MKEFEYEFNPIKESIGGKKAQSITWSTKSLNTAVDAINKGLPLKANPFLGNNTGLLRPELVFKRTKEEVDMCVECLNDITHFGSLVSIMTPEGIKKVKLRDYQIKYLQHLQNNPFSIFLACRQAGKSVTTAIFVLWLCIFHVDIAALVISKSYSAGTDLIAKIKSMYINLPYFLKPGIYKWNIKEISFDNNSTISTEAFSTTAGLGKTINCLVLDEFAWCNENEVELFYNNIIPTITTMPNAKVCIMSTQNGFNFFYKLWAAALNGKNSYATYKVDWQQVPNWNPKTRTWDNRDDKWKEKMVGILGGEANFYYQYGTIFSASDKCLINRNTLELLNNKGEDFILYNPEQNNDFYINLNNYNLYIKKDYILSKDKLYTVLVDIAEGGGGDSDSTVFHIFEITGKDEFMQVGYWISNEVSIEQSSFNLWLLCSQLTKPENLLLSIEWNTYGSLMYTYLLLLNDKYYENNVFPISRFNIAPNGIDTYSIVKYSKKINQDYNNESPGKNNIPGIKWNSNNKSSACKLAKLSIENKKYNICDFKTIRQIENFEDYTGKGNYKAMFGHDDLVMTIVQLPMLQQTFLYKNFIEEKFNPFIIQENYLQYDTI